MLPLDMVPNLAPLYAYRLTLRGVDSHTTTAAYEGHSVPINFLAAESFSPWLTFQLVGCNTDRSTTAVALNMFNNAGWYQFPSHEVPPLVGKQPRWQGMSNHYNGSCHGYRQESRPALILPNESARRCKLLRTHSEARERSNRHGLSPE